MKMTVMTKIMAFGLIVILASSIYFNKRDEGLVDECSVQIEGIVIKLHKAKNSGYSARVKYSVGAVFVESVCYVGRKHPYYLGESVNISYACKDSTIIRIDSTTVIPDD